MPRKSNKEQEKSREEFSKEFKVSGEKLVKKVKELIKEGNARKIIIKDEKGKSIMEIPLTVGAVGVLLAPVLAAVGALAALLTECTIVVVKEKGK
ncbi:DUF4342 domain-containing protein [Candidatus Falkowbacteria bacterium]|nr:DUF4342 domain-containing protein [Candidatus Falkowbacteria bacterium]